MSPVSTLEPQVPAAIRQAFDGPHRDVWLIANNLKLRYFPLESLPIGPESLLIQFNRARFFERLSALDCRKDFCFVGRDDPAHTEGAYHGFGPDGRPLQPLDAQSHRGLRLALVGGDTEANGARLRAVMPEVEVLSVPKGSIVLRGYPSTLKASSGFAVLQIHHAIEVERVAAGLPRRPINLVGFTGYGRAAWHGHDWWAEQQWLRSVPVTRHAENARDSFHTFRALRWWFHHRLALRHGRRE